MNHKRLIADWLWRLAMLAALGWIGLELHGLHEQLLQPADDAETVQAAGDDTLNAIDELRDDLAGLTQKVDAILIVMARSR